MQPARSLALAGYVFIYSGNFFAVGIPLLAIFGTAFTSTAPSGLADTQTEALDALFTSVSLVTATAILTGI